MPAQALVSSSGDDNVLSFAAARERRQHRRAEISIRDTAAMRIILVEWRIKKGQEGLFLDHWSRRAVVPEREGLIGEFLSRVESPEDCPWMIWELDQRWTTFVNVGLWRDGAAFDDQIGRFLDNSQPSLPFEAQRRRRVFVAPERWRFGGTPLPVSEHGQVR